MTNYRCNQFTKWQPNLVLAILKKKSFYNGKSVMPLYVDFPLLFLVLGQKQIENKVHKYTNKVKTNRGFFFEIPTLLFSEQEYHEWENLFFLNFHALDFLILKR